MKTLQSQPNLVEQVREALLAEIASGALPPGERVVQEQIAQALGVSRQPVQQALRLLLEQGVLQDAPGRRLIVKPLDPEHVRNMYDLRAVVEGLAARRAAQLHGPAAERLGRPLIDSGRKAVAAGSVPRMIAADVRFHEFVHALSGNTLVSQVLSPHLVYMQRVMGEVLTGETAPRDVWNEHEAILDAIVAGDAAKAERLSREHIFDAADFMVGRFEQVAEIAA
jgi:DNA-binding GntR family transcriptional regulator